MGRKLRSIQAATHYQTVYKLIAGGHTKDTPVWHDVLRNIAPSEKLVRTRPVQLQVLNSKRHLPHRTFIPQRITFFEDRLRKRFYQDHPWELARPRVIVERHGTDSKNWNWAKGLQQPGIPLCGECVVQRQMWLMENYQPGSEPTVPEKKPKAVDEEEEGWEALTVSLVEPERKKGPAPGKGLSVAAAYDIARREFYALRHREEVAARIQHEESMKVGGTFAPRYVDRGYKLEEEAVAKWLQWAKKNVEQRNLQREAVRASNSLLESDDNDPRLQILEQVQDKL